MKGINLVLFIGCILLVLALPLTLAICGASSQVTFNPEHDGYCKITYGEDFKYKIDSNFCFNKINYSERYYFTEESYKEVCPNHKFLDGGIYSDCFKASESLS